MAPCTRITVALFLALSIMTELTLAWTFADRVSGRAFPRKVITRYNTRRQATTEDKSSTQFDKADMLNFMEDPVENAVGDLPTLSDMDDADLDFVKSIVKAADGRKAEDIVTLRVSHVSTLCSFLVILSGNSRPQNQAIAAAVRKDVEEEYGQRPGGTGVPEGSAESGWMLLDYGSVMVHIMTPKSRLYYNVEGQWREKGGEEIDMSSVLIPNKPEGMNDLTGESGFVEQEDDPFWS